MAQTIGDVSVFYSYFEWRIPDFFDRPENLGESCRSPKFQVARNSWVISLYPNGSKTPEFISLFLKRLTTDGDKFAYFTLAIKKSDGSQYELRAEHLFSQKEFDWGWQSFMKKSVILNKKDVMVPGDVLTISCTICSEPFPTEAAWYASKPLQLSNGGVSTRPKILWESLSCDLKDLFLNHTNSDIVIKVGDEEFPVHKTILSGRSTVFAAMFEHSMRENLSGVVEISDANPAVFRDFLLFLYSGEIRTLSSENVYDMFVLSDKYNVKDLKEECTSFMERALSVDTFCNVLLHAEKYSEVQLKNFAEKYFIKHVAEIMASDQWKVFESENVLQAFQLLKSTLLEKVSQ